MDQIILSQHKTMSEFPLQQPQPTSKRIRRFPSLLFSDFFIFYSFITSHPLYFSYFVFFSPYLLKLLSFLSPLFITTFLLLLALLTVSPNIVLDTLAPELSESKASLVLGIYRSVVEKLRAKVGHGGEEFHQYVELEAYKIVFEARSPDLAEDPVEVLEIEVKEQPLVSSDDDNVEASCCPSLEKNVSEGNSAQVNQTTELLAEVKPLAGFLHEKEELDFEGLVCKKEVVHKPVSVNSNKVEGERRRQDAARSGSKGIGNTKCEAKESDHRHYSIPKSDVSQRVDEADEDDSCSPDNGNWDYYSPKGDQYSPILCSFGSMRSEKEWRKTLACKLFEERNNVDGGEGNMDMLWEAYEADSAKSQGNAISKSKKKGKSSKFGSTRSAFSYDHYGSEDDDAEDEEGRNGKLCCLQALKFSTGKMNLGMGRPNLVKFSKVIKGFGWLHKVGSHSKKAQRF